MSEPNSSTPEHKYSTAVPALSIALLLPFFVLVVSLWLSPNFHWHPTSERQTPYGSDFLQEWIGGQIVLSEDRARLYDLKFVHAREHDSEHVGFDWSPDDYYPMVYPPFHYVFFSPFSRLSYRYAVLAWAVVSTLLFVGTGWMLMRFYRPMQKKFFAWIVAMAFFLPWINCVSMGQKSTLLLFLFTSTFLLLQRQRNFFAGLVFGIVAIKPQLGLVIGAVMILKRQWSFVAGAGLMVGALVGISWLIEPTWWSDYLTVMAGMGDFVETAGYQLNDSHSLWGGLKLSFPFLNPSIVKAIAGAFAVAVLGLVAWGISGGWHPSSERFAFQFAMLVLATILLSPHFYGYDLTIALLPLALIASRIGWRPQETSKAWLLGLSAAFYVLAGSFPEIAKTIYVQPSLFLMVGMVGTLAYQARQRSGFETSRV